MTEMVIEKGDRLKSVYATTKSIRSRAIRNILPLHVFGISSIDMRLIVIPAIFSLFFLFHFQIEAPAYPSLGINSEASLLFHPFFPKRYAIANKPAIAKTASNPSIPGCFSVGSSLTGVFARDDLPTFIV
jgi:hypothetical protein